MKAHTDINISALKQAYSLQYHPIIEEVEFVEINPPHQPVVRRQKTTEENCQILCRECNRKK